MSIDLTAVDCAALYERKRRELLTWLAAYFLTRWFLSLSKK